MEGLSFEDGEDYKNMANEIMYASVIKLASERKGTIENLDKVNQHNAQRIIKRSKQFTEDEISYENIVVSMSKLNQYSLTRVAVF